MEKESRWQDSSRDTRKAEGHICSLQDQTCSNIQSDDIAFALCRLETLTC